MKLHNISRKSEELHVQMEKIDNLQRQMDADE